jgi:hypothetical protein
MSEKSWAETRCERRVGNPSDRDTCHRKATVFRNGRQWCKWHDPAKPTRLERAQAERAVSDDMEAIHHGAVSLRSAGQWSEPSVEALAQILSRTSAYLANEPPVSRPGPPQGGPE